MRRLGPALIFLLVWCSPERAHAGWFLDICGRHLVADDPYEYEAYATAWVERQRDQLEIRRVWNRATPADLNKLKILEAELRRREALARLVGE